MNHLPFGRIQPQLHYYTQHNVQVQEVDASQFILYPILCCEYNQLQFTDEKTVTKLLNNLSNLHRFFWCLICPFLLTLFICTSLKNSIRNF